MIKDDVVEKCVGNLNIILTRKLSIPHNLLLLFLEQEIESSEKHELIGNSLEDLGGDSVAAQQVADYFELANLSDLIRALRGYRPLVPISQPIERILEMLKAKEWIAKFTKDRRQSDKFRVSGLTVNHPLPD